MMHVDGTEQHVDRVVGADRDPFRIATAIAGGTSVVITGSLGSGKSHLLRSVTADLQRRGVDPVTIRPGRPLATVPFGALDSSPDVRCALLRADEPSDAPPLVVIVDDAQHLDPESGDALMRAIYRGRAVVLLGIEVPRARLLRDTVGVDSTSMFVDLWLHGLAERLDLGELVPPDAERLLDLFPGTGHFDAITRATVISLADGSRILLREFAAQANAALAGGRDPIVALRDVHRHSRLGDALFAHVAQLAEQERLAMAILGRIPGAQYANATRFIPSSTVDALVAGGLVYEDGTVRRRLFANTAIATEAEHQLDPGVLDDAIERMAGRLLTATGWWSIPLAFLVAQRWHGDPESRPTIADTPPELRQRIALDAARRANDQGANALAAAYSSLGGDELGPALALERDYAEALMTRATSTPSSLSLLDPRTLDRDTLFRYLQLSAHVVARHPRSLLDELAAIEADAGSDDRIRSAIDLCRAEYAVMSWDWAGATALATSAAERPGADDATRLRALLTAAVGTVHDGRWADAAALLGRADHLISIPGAPAAMTSAERVMAFSIEVIVSQLAGVDSSLARARLHDATLTTAREHDPLAVAVAGLTAALVRASLGDAGEALTEVQAAADRAATLPLGPTVMIIQLAVARSLALMNRAADARTILRRVGPVPSGLRILDHAHKSAESAILVAEGRIEEAVALAEEAAEISEGANEKAQYLRDLYDLAALGAGDDVLAQRMRRIADSVDLPIAPILAERGVGIVRGRKSLSRRTPLELLRLGAPWSDGGGLASTSPAVAVPAASQRFLHGIGTARADAAPSRTTLGLTKREWEIGVLVAEGLTNREVAERLFLSVRTVESHVYQARSKVGARSRAELGRIVGRGSATRGDGTLGQH